MTHAPPSQSLRRSAHRQPHVRRPDRSVVGWRAFVNPALWALVKVVVGPPCERVAGTWKLLHDFGLRALEPDDVDGESSQEGLVDDDAMETDC